MNIYFDHNATTPLDPLVLEAMLPYLKGNAGNPSSVHQDGRLARLAIEQARAQVAALVNATPSQVIFTSGGSEANNLALKGATEYLRPSVLSISTVEHDSVLKTAETLSRRGWHIDWIPVDEAGHLNLSSLASDTRFISVMWANNESGVIHNLSAVAALARQRGAIFHTDAVQALGKIPVDFSQSGAQLMTLSSHKISGPQGAGACIIDRRIEIAPLIDGGGQEYGLRSGTENVAAIVGFGKAAELAEKSLSQRQAYCLSLREQLESGLASIPGLKILAQQSERLPNTVLVVVPGISGETLLMRLDQDGFSVGSGSACGSGGGEPSHVLKAMQIPEEQADCVIRISMAYQNQPEDVVKLLECLRQQVNLLQ